MSAAIRKEVEEFLSIAPLPPSGSADEAHVTQLTDALTRISAPISEEEAVHLSSAFGEDDCFGLAWTLVHLIETAPRAALDRIPPSDNRWIRLIRDRLYSA